MDNIHFLWQYGPILLSSFTYLIYLVWFKPYKTFAWNCYMIITEIFYLFVLILLFFFMDDFPPLGTRLVLVKTIMILIVLIVLMSLVMTIYLTLKGPHILKEAERESKLKRQEKEVLELAEKEVRKLIKEKEKDMAKRKPGENDIISII